MAKTPSGTLMQKGASAPDFSLPGIDGRTHSLADFAGKEGLFVLFMCNHCPYVKARMEEVVELYKDFGGAIAFAGINSNDPEYPGEGMELMKEFAKERGMEFPYLIDADGSVARAYGATCTPDPFLFDKDMKLVFHGKIVDALEPQDAVREHTMRENMQKLLVGGAIEPWFDPSLGCSIKFKTM
ncbi:thioredoxin family protein [Candidatus Kaiserbacteria bacterium]|nr:thioredoxin family protein [Candidatus Kaiserbacteria bacterium]